MVCLRHRVATGRLQDCIARISAAEFAASMSVMVVSTLLCLLFVSELLCAALAVLCSKSCKGSCKGLRAQSQHLQVLSELAVQHHSAICFSRSRWHKIHTCCRRAAYSDGLQTPYAGLHLWLACTPGSVTLPAGTLHLLLLHSCIVWSSLRTGALRLAQ